MINPEKEDHYKEVVEPSGTLLDISLTDVLQVLSVNRKTCTLFLRKDDEKGEVYLREGKIVDAKSGDMRGEEALYYLLNWEGADFFIGTSVEASVKIRIEKDLHALILDWIDQRDKYGKKKEVKTAANESIGEKSEAEDETVTLLKRLESSGVILAIKQ